MPNDRGMANLIKTQSPKCLKNTLMAPLEKEDKNSTDSLFFQTFDSTVIWQVPSLQRRSEDLGDSISMQLFFSWM